MYLNLIAVIYSRSFTLYIPQFMFADIKFEMNPHVCLTLLQPLFLKNFILKRYETKKEGQSFTTFLSFS